MLAEAGRRGVRIVRTVETHTHADHLSGHGRLALEHGIPVSIHPAAEAEYAHDPLEDGVEIELGEVVLRAIHTPGHRPEHSCLAVIDRTRADEPWLVLTGDSLFVGDAARPDLAVGAKEGAEGLFHSLRRLLELRRRRRGLPRPRRRLALRQGDELEGVLDDRLRAPLQRRAPDRARATTSSPSPPRSSAPKPPNMTRLVELNRGPFVGARRDVTELPAPPPGATVLDVRAGADVSSRVTRTAR